MGKKPEKTNVMRLLDQAGICYLPHTYNSEDGKIDGLAVAQKLNQPPGQVFKTLVCRGASGGIFVYVISVADALDLKLAAKAAGEKSVAMLPQKELLPTTGYIHGGCSPIGMKKPYPVLLDESALAFDRMMFSAGKIGFQVELAPIDLLRISGGRTAALVRREEN